MIQNSIILELYPTAIQKKEIDSYIKLGKQLFASFFNKALTLKNLKSFDTISNEFILKNVKELTPTITEEKIVIINSQLESVKTCIKTYLQNSDTLENFLKKHLNQNSYELINKTNSIKLYSNYIYIPHLGNIKTNTINNIYKNQKLIMIKIYRENEIYKVNLNFKKYYSIDEMLTIINSKKPNFINTYLKISKTSDIENIILFKTDKKYLDLLKLHSLENMLKQNETYSESWYTILNRFHKLGNKIIYSSYIYS